jgi:hypothetical protein
MQDLRCRHAAEVIILEGRANAERLLQFDAMIMLNELFTDRKYRENISDRNLFPTFLAKYHSKVLCQSI